jgi:hypothetical protein
MKRKRGTDRYFSDRLRLARTIQKTWILIAFSKFLVLLVEIVHYWIR